MKSGGMIADDPRDTEKTLLAQGHNQIDKLHSRLQEFLSGGNDRSSVFKEQSAPLFQTSKHIKTPGLTPVKEIPKKNFNMGSEASIHIGKDWREYESKTNMLNQDRRLSGLSSEIISPLGGRTNGPSPLHLNSIKRVPSPGSSRSVEQLSQLPLSTTGFNRLIDSKVPTPKHTGTGETVESLELKIQTLLNQNKEFAVGNKPQIDQRITTRPASEFFSKRDPTGISQTFGQISTPVRNPTRLEDPNIQIPNPPTATFAHFVDQGFSASTGSKMLSSVGNPFSGGSQGKLNSIASLNHHIPSTRAAPPVESFKPIASDALSFSRPQVFTQQQDVRQNLQVTNNYEPSFGIAPSYHGKLDRLLAGFEERKRQWLQDKNIRQHRQQEIKNPFPQLVHDSLLEDSESVPQLIKPVKVIKKQNESDRDVNPKVRAASSARNGREVLKGYSVEKSILNSSLNTTYNGKKQKRTARRHNSQRLESSTKKLRKTVEKKPKAPVLMMSMQQKQNRELINTLADLVAQKVTRNLKTQANQSSTRTDKYTAGKLTSSGMVKKKNPNNLSAVGTRDRLTSRPRVSHRTTHVLSKK
jgi:hypothetical protein